MFIAGIPVVVYALVLVLAAVVLLFVRAGTFLRGVTRRVPRTVWCPLHDRELRAELEEEVWDGRRVDVTRCEAFSPPTAVTCGKACLRLTTRPRPQAAPSRLPLLF